MALGYEPYQAGEAHKATIDMVEFEAHADLNEAGILARKHGQKIKKGIGKISLTDSVYYKDDSLPEGQQVKAWVQSHYAGQAHLYTQVVDRDQNGVGEPLIRVQQGSPERGRLLIYHNIPNGRGGTVNAEDLDSGERLRLAQNVADTVGLILQGMEKLAATAS